MDLEPFTSFPRHTMCSTDIWRCHLWLSRSPAQDNPPQIPLPPPDSRKQHRQHTTPCFAGTQSSPMSRNEGTQPPSGALTASGLSPSTRNHSQTWSQLRPQPSTPAGLQRAPYSKVLQTPRTAGATPGERPVPSTWDQAPAPSQNPEPQTPALPHLHAQLQQHQQHR